MPYNAHLAVYHSQKPIKGELHIVIENYLSHKRLESFLSLILDVFQYLTLFFFSKQSTYNQIISYTGIL